MKQAVYAGSFDPITLGHISVIERALNIFDHIHIIVANNNNKKHSFTLFQRTEMVKASINNHAITVVQYPGIVADYINLHNIDVVIRGIRNATDLEYELKLEEFIRRTTCAETVYLSPHAIHMQTSSSLVRLLFETGKGEHASMYMNPKAFDLANGTY
jgi:pantetheine-phosphate adenylyltransferase